MFRLSTKAGIPASYANRHGLITGQTGSGKTVTLMRLVEEFSRAGVPSFVADVKGDIAALSRSCPAQFLDLYGRAGRPIHLTFDAMGADLVSRALELSDAQSGAVEIAFAVARDAALPLQTITDFRAVLAHILANREAIGRAYGLASPASVGVVQRALLRMDAERIFAAPAFDVAELLQPGLVSILAADKLMTSPRLYGAFLLFILSDLYERMPEVGDLAQPRLVLFFDEAHLLFQDCPPALLRRIEQTVRLIRSKGIGVYFVSQSPQDVPQLIRDQLAHRIEHDRALPIGTARFATLRADGRPAPAQTVAVDLPAAPLGALTPAERYFPPASVEPPQRPSPWRIIVVCLLVLAALGAWAVMSGHALTVITAAVGVLSLRKGIILAVAMVALTVFVWGVMFGV